MRRDRLAFSVLALGLTLAPLAVSWADAPAASSSGATSASASSARPLAPRFADDLPPAEATPAPSADEWKAALRIRLDRPLGDGCSASRVREWVRISCVGVGASVGLVAGVADGFTARVGIPGPGASDASVSYWAQFPVRRGDRRLIEVRHAGRGNYDETLYAGNAFYVSVQWNDGEAPMLVPHD